MGQSNRFLQGLLRLCCPPSRLDDVEGDFEELFEERVKELGKTRATLYFIFDALSLIPLKLLTRQNNSHRTNNLMIRNYVKVARRNLAKDKAYAFINIFGLAVGMACAFVILVFVRLELSYDIFHEKGDQIHRVQHVYSVISAPIGPKMVEEYPGVVGVTRLNPFSTDIKVKVDQDKVFYEDFLIADNNFFETFTFQFIQGSPSEALKSPESVVITESVALRYFGKTDVLGEVIETETLMKQPSLPLKISGVIEDVPHNSHLQFDHVVSFELMTRYRDPGLLDSWVVDWIVTYLVLQPGADPVEIENDYKRFYLAHSGREFTDLTFRLMPMKDVRHHSSYLRSDFIEQGNINHIKIFSAVAILVLIIACINYMNLATAKSAQRAKEVGLRKVMGAVPKQLIGQFMVESILISFLALILAGGFVMLSLPLLQSISGIDLRHGLTDIGGIIAMGVGISVLTGILAGSYPAVYLSSFAAADILKDARNNGKSSGIIRKSLVVLQLSVSVSLIVGALIVLDQMQFVQNRDLGFKTDQTMVLDYGFTPTLNPKWDLIKTQIMGIPGVKEVAATNSVPGDNAPFWGYQFEGDEENEGGDGWPGYYVGPNAIDLLEMEMVMGRSFSEEIESDKSAFLLNETGWTEAIAKYGDHWKEPLGKTIAYYVEVNGQLTMQKKGPVIGVVKDFHFRSLQNEIESLVIHQSPRNWRVMAKVDAANVTEITAAIEEVWPQWGSSKPFSYEFLNQKYAEYYASEKRFSNILYVFCGLAISIACLGLFGLASFMAQQRIKEIGIRKVLGASVVGIFGMITSDFAKLIIVALILAFPLSWYLGNSWLDNFAYRIDISWLSFLIAALLIAFLTLFTVSWQALKASKANPVDSLRSE
ncbi:MAG: FtsX-like permease family protein [Cyclobacteriaceae bacterium]